jgi:Tat protein secretion system quality control protein TatD with DNase activity
MVSHEFPRAQRARAKLWFPSNDQPWNQRRHHERVVHALSRLASGHPQARALAMGEIGLDESVRRISR